MGDSEGAESDGGGSSQASGGAGVDPTDTSKMSEKDLKKWNKNLLAWRMFIDFIFRHVAIVTFKYNNFERDNMKQFLAAVDKAEVLRGKTKLKKGETANITSFRALRDSTAVLQDQQAYREADLILQLVDLCGRMRCLGMIGGGFYKSLKKGNVKGIDNIKKSLDFWKGFCLRGYDYGELQFKNADVESLSAIEQKHLAWSTAIRTAINMSQQFLKKASDATGLPLISADPSSIQKFMRASEYAVATKIQELLNSRDTTDTATGISAAALLGGKGALVMKQTLSTQTGEPGKSKHGRSNKMEDIDEEMLKPIPDDGLLFVLPPEAPVDKKGKKGGKKGKKGGGKKKGGKKKKK